MLMKLIFEGKASVQDMLVLAGLGYSFVIEDGKVTKIIDPFYPGDY